MKNVFVIVLLLVQYTMALEIGKIPPLLTIENTNGGKLDGTPWCSTMLKDKIYVLFYIDPDKKELNDNFVDALKKEKFNRKKFSSVAIINLEATWLPNAIIESKLEEKQKKFPNTIYVKDEKRLLVKHWKVADNNSDILIFDKKGRLLYQNFGEISEKKIPEVIKLIKKSL